MVYMGFMALGGFVIGLGVGIYIGVTVCDLVAEESENGG